HSSSSSVFSSFMLRRSPSSPLFPYTTLFRSHSCLEPLILQRLSQTRTPDASSWFTPCMLLPQKGMVRTTNGTQHVAHFRNQLVSDRKSTRLNSSHQIISYAVFCLKKKKILST